MSTRIAVFNAGRIEQVGTPVEIYEQPATAFVAGFVGTSNLLDDHVSASLIGDARPHTLRPERISILRLDDPLPEGAIDAIGSVVDVQYLGSFSRLRVHLEGGGVLVASVASDALAGVTDGVKVRLTWPADAAIVVANSKEPVNSNHEQP